MKTLDFIQLACLAAVFVCALISAIAFYGHGFATWCWQVLTMYYVAREFMHEYKAIKAK